MKIFCTAGLDIFYKRGFHATFLCLVDRAARSLYVQVVSLYSEKPQTYFKQHLFKKNSLI